MLVLLTPGQQDAEELGPDSEPKVVLRPQTQKTDLGLPMRVGVELGGCINIHTTIYR